MKSHTQRGWLLLLAAGVSGGAAGCGRDARLAGKHIRDVQVRAVEHFGIHLDAAASVEQVVEVLLRALHADVNAPTRADRDAAIDIQLDVCAAETLNRRKHDGQTREEWLYQVVSSWAAAVAHYLRGDESRLSAVLGSVVVVEHEDGGEPVAEARLTLADPADPRGGVYAIVRLVREGAAGDSVAEAAKFWRVSGIYFQPGRRPAPALDGIAARDGASDVRPADAPSRQGL
ncbi:MAG: hypothetical protein KJ057_05275 [Phycisphaerae bacterium]|nr:MAG: hypothetical protein EDS66_02045 [Planctomycetota bacterium]KAB2948754.1 MAG: hypothetical protein F9K17_05505 [Phycisphaerae bacterium]MBE7456829.1 hypothetical protein [Planctomycetia bacterium]MCK6464277.1 hypothetical protein [Phycisphaerae bacterium]MCL4717869.1 hypothetical protein [Phycisphaerae bacterium]